MKFLLIVFSILYSSCGIGLYAAQTSIRPTEFVSMSYALEGIYRFKAEHSYPIIHESGQGYFIHIMTEHDRVVFLEKLDRVPARRVDQGLKFWEDFEFKTDRAYLTFMPENWYRVLSQTDSEYLVQYSIGQTTMQCSVPKDNFELGRHYVDADGKLRSLEVNDPKDAVCLITFPGGASGTGFLLYDGDILYCYTNQHVAMNAGTMRISLIDGTTLKPGYLEVAEDVDLARIQIPSSRPGFVRVGEVNLNTGVKVLGNSLGSGRVTILEGKINGLSRKELETSAKFVSGNSGSPILNQDSEVLGVATLLEMFPDHNAIIKGTEFENGRRIGIRLDREIEWIKVDLGSYISRNQSIIRTLAFLNELPRAMALAASDEFTQKLELKHIEDRVIVQWLTARSKSMNAVISKYKPLVDQGVARQGATFYYTSEFAAMRQAYTEDLVSESEKYWNTLARNVSMKRRTVSMQKPYPDTSYMRQKIEICRTFLETAESVIRTIAETHRDFAELK